MSSQIRVTLADEKKKIHPQTEMIVTKQKGRVLFSHLDYVVTGLVSTSLYTIKIHLERVDDIKYKYEGDEWVEAMRGVPRQPIQQTEHEDGARDGKHWMGGTVSFAKLKITNDPRNKNEKLVLVQSMHKYKPVLTITRLGEPIGQEFRHDLTEFIVVTAYQSEEVTQLKVSLNKFAAGFRPNGGKRPDHVESVPNRPIPSQFSANQLYLLLPPSDVLSILAVLSESTEFYELDSSKSAN